MKPINPFTAYALTPSDTQTLCGGLSFADPKMPTTAPEQVEARLTLIRDRYRALSVRLIELLPEDPNVPIPTRVNRIEARMSRLFVRFTQIAAPYYALEDAQ